MAENTEFEKSCGHIFCNFFMILKKVVGEKKRRPRHEFVQYMMISCLSREQREVSGKDYLSEQYSRYIKLKEASNLLVRRMRVDLLTEPREGFSYLKNNNSASSSGSQTPSALELRPFGIRRRADWSIINNVMPNISTESAEEEI